MKEEEEKSSYELLMVGSDREMVDGALNGEEPPRPWISFIKTMMELLKIIFDYLEIIYIYFNVFNR